MHTYAFPVYGSIVNVKNWKYVLAKLATEWLSFLKKCCNVVLLIDKLKYTWNGTREVNNLESWLINHNGDTRIVGELNCVSAKLMFLLLEDRVIDILEMMLHINSSFAFTSSLTRYLWFS